MVTFDYLLIIRLFIWGNGCRFNGLFFYLRLVLSFASSFALGCRYGYARLRELALSFESPFKFRRIFGDFKGLLGKGRRGG